MTYLPRNDVNNPQSPGLRVPDRRYADHDDPLCDAPEEPDLHRDYPGQEVPHHRWNYEGNIGGGKNGYREQTEHDADDKDPRRDAQPVNWLQCHK